MEWNGRAINPGESIPVIDPPAGEDEVDLFTTFPECATLKLWRNSDGLSEMFANKSGTCKEATMAEKEKETREIAPWRGGRFMSVFDEMDRMFDRLMGRGFMLPRVKWGEGFELAYPDVDIYEEDNKVVLKAEIPGVKKDELTIDVSEDAITISGEKKKEEKVEKKDYFRLERSFGSFSRSFSLPSGVDADKAKASFKDGVLQITLPKKEGAKKKKIEVTES